MKISPIIPSGRDAPHCLLHEDGSAVLLDSLCELLVAEIKGHGHYGNVCHHVASGDWVNLFSALRALLALPYDHHALSPLAKNLVTMLDGKSAANLRPFRDWLLNLLEDQTTNLYRASLARRLDVLEKLIRA